jgi:bifunctional DNase/RNase
MGAVRIALAWAAALSLAGSARAATVEVKVGGMGIDRTVGAPIVRLVEKRAAGRALTIWIGPYEAQAIAMELQGMPSPRPQTHDLMKQLVERLGGKLDRVVIAELRDDTYFATMHLAAPDGKDLKVDARPSDAIALALRLHGPIFVEDGLLAKAELQNAATRLWGVTVQNLTPDLASFFSVPARQGVVVSDVADDAAAHDLARGDVITAVDGEPIGSVDELAARADARAEGDPVRLSVRRADQTLDVSFAQR